jgi:hypothetical protein
MVIGERFAFAHLPKTAGDATAEMLAAVPDLVRFADPPTSEDKHMPFFGRASEIEGKLLVMGFRRLPAWLLSGAQHRATHGLYPDYTPAALETPEEIVAKTDPDDLLRWMTDHGRFGVDHWLRAESLLTDVLTLLDTLGVLNRRVERRVRAVGEVNSGRYDHAVEHHFTPAQVAATYQRNPEWASVERSLYGGLLTG